MSNMNTPVEVLDRTHSEEVYGSFVEFSELSSDCVYVVDSMDGVSVPPEMFGAFNDLAVDANCGVEGAHAELRAGRKFLENTAQLRLDKASL